jgi:hypothetical protein
VIAAMDAAKAAAPVKSSRKAVARTSR